MPSRVVSALALALRFGLATAKQERTRTVHSNPTREARAGAGSRLHALDGANAEQIQALLDHAGGQVAEQEAPLAEHGSSRVEHPAVLVKPTVALGQVPEVGRDRTRPVFRRRRVERFLETEE